MMPVKIKCGDRVVPERQDEETGRAVFPPVVYVPCAEPSGTGHEVALELRRIADGRTALLAYSALDRLVSCCGPRQPWVLLPAAKLDEVGERTHFDVILLDVAIPEELRRGTAG